MPTLSASDYTSFIKAQAAAQSYRNGAIPNKIQTSDQPFTNQSVLNSQLLASQAAYITKAKTPVITVNATTVSSASVTTVTNGASAILSAATANIVTAAVGSTTYITYTTSVAHGLTTSDTVSITGITGYAAANVTSAAVTATPTTTSFRVALSTNTTSVSGQSGQINIGPAAAATVYYTSSVAHGLAVGDTVTITGFTTQGNVTSKTITKVIDSTKFAIANVGTGVGTGTGTITGSTYYITSVVHGLSVGDVITITGMTNFNASLLTVAKVISTTQFVLANGPTNATADSGKTGTIVGRVYYTTTAPYTGISPNAANTTVAISGITGNTTFNLSGIVIACPTTSVFVISSNGASGAAVTGKSGSITTTLIINPTTSINGIARIRPYDGVGYVNNPKSLVTLTQSGTLNSGKTQQLGGIPTTAPKGSGVYSPTPQLARVDTKATGAYKAVRSPV